MYMLYNLSMKKVFLNLAPRAENPKEKLIY